MVAELIKGGTMKERPIIFSTEMVRAILEGRKTQTRRVIKPQPQSAMLDFHKVNFAKYCPYGQVGDRLWVKETWWDDCALREKEGYKQDDYLYYRADGEAIEQFECAYGFKWRSPLFMPRWASRIILEITGLRVEQLQDITEEDAVTEGLPSREQTGFDTARYRYHILWDSLNAKRGYAWDSNPWVWVMEFKRLSD